MITLTLSCSSGGGPVNPNNNVNDNSTMSDARGACCQTDGTCSELTSRSCSGQFRGVRTTCATADCPQATGACCADGECSVTTRAACDGAFQGNGSACVANACGVSAFTEEAQARGLDVQIIYGRCPEAGSGVGFIDFDNDGDADLIVLGEAGAGIVRVFENDGQGYFTDRSESSGIPPSPMARGVSAGDYDSDGDLDVYLSQWLAPNILLRNDGDFTFTDVTDMAGVGGVGHGAGTAWADFDGDGWLDLYVANWEYDDFNFYYHNLGNGTFEEIAVQKGIASGERSYQPVFIDYDLDGAVELMLSNDNRLSNCGPNNHNRLFKNMDGTCRDVSLETGANICLNSMGVAVGDFDNNLFLDMYFTNLPPGNKLLMNQGDGTFLEESERTGTDTRGATGWGTVAFDYDHDGYEELYVVNANAADRFYENDGTFPLRDVALELGVFDTGEGYCVAVADIDGDGDLDMVQSIRQTKLKLYINNEGQKRRWVKFNVISERAFLHGVGATVSIRTGEKRQIRQLMLGNNYKSQNESLLHFGLGSARMIDEINVMWSAGCTRTLRNYSANQTWKLYPPEKLGDVNADGQINDVDRAAFSACRGMIRPGCEVFDMDGDGDVDNADEALLP